MKRDSRKGMKTFEIYLEERVDLQIYIKDELDNNIQVEPKAITVKTDSYRGEATAKCLKEALGKFVQMVMKEPTYERLLIDPMFRIEYNNELLSIVRVPIVRVDEIEA